jgi:RNA polymerase primary sigma factor
MLKAGITRMKIHDPDDPVAMYISEIASCETLAEDEETQLFRKLAGAGDWDEIVARRLIEAHLAQVVSIGQKYSASGVPLLDLIQEGNIGLMNAIKSFAETPVGDFTGYAATCVDDAIKKALG